ncbi:MAG: phosphomannomutase/phosphoglucomutase [Candidatus Thiodiazotropha sp. (ex Monitilora ramsayi)]|nr:phosphomannomutase/phosphoglucomutase [Candidatus Thiodiazotropha sp. (ex Monitilora ramsayi)]
MKRKGETEKQTQGGRGIRGYLLIGVLGLLVLTLVSTTAIYFQSEASHNVQAKQQTQAAAQAIANHVEVMNWQRRQLIENLAQQPLLIDLFETGDAVGLVSEQNRLTRLIPDALQIRLLPAGTSEPDTELEPNMSYASLQMLRRAEERDGVLPAEAHQYSTAHQHIAIASGVRRTPGAPAVGVLHAAFSLSGMQELLNSVDDYAGRVELQQIVPDKAPFTLASKGPAVESGSPDRTMPISGTIWQLAYWGGTGTRPGMVDRLSLMGPGLLVFLLVSALLFLLSQQIIKALKKDQSVILTLFEAMVAGRPPKPQSAKLGDLQPTLDVLEHQLREHRASLAEKVRGRQAGAGAGIAVEEQLPEVMEKSSVSLTEPVDISPTIFRAYDIRGVVEETLTEEVVARLGQGIGSEVFDRGFQSVLVARDARNSSESLQSALIQGLKASGRDVVDIGLVPTPMLNYAIHEHNIECGVIITGSHNPPQYNGLKLVIGGDSPTREGIQELRRRIDAHQLLQGEGSFDSMDVTSDYIERIVSDIRLGQPMKVVVDCGNAAASVVAPELYRQLGCEVIELYCTVDGSFPNHHPDPGDPKNMAALQQAVVEHQAALGLAFDGDGDRLGVVDSSGKLIWPDRLLMYLATDVLSREPGGDIIYDVKCSRHLANIILSSGGRPLMWKSGHSNLKSKMKESHALLAGEFSGHIMFSERWYGFDDGLYAGARLLEMLSLDYRTSAEVFAELPEGLATPEYALRLEEGKAQEVMKAVDQLPDLPGARLVKIDGLRAEFEQGWGLVRASNTTPALLFRFESDSEEGLAHVQSIFRDLLAKVAPDLTAPF